VTREARIIASFKFYASVGGVDLLPSVPLVPFLRLALRTERRFLFFFDIVDLFLNECFEGLSNEVATFVEGNGFGTVEKLSVRGVVCRGFQVIEVGGSLFEEVFFGCLVGEFLAGGHGKSFRVREI
jgi:hypothetical protein